MIPSSTIRLLRRPRTGIFSLFIVIFFLVLLNFNGQIPSPNSYISWLAPKPSPYYTIDDTKYYSWKTPSFFPPLKRRFNSKPDDFCDGFPSHLLDNVQIILKTGAGASAKTKAHITTVTSCITNLLVFSDMDEKIAGHQIIDLFEDLPESYRNHSDFATYFAQKQAYSEGKPIEYSSEGWKLDRFKFLPMVDKAYKMRPKAQWYVFIEVDVYYFWDTLFRLLNQLDPSKMHYIGSPAPGPEGTFFAYGGAGFVLSRGLMKSLTADSVPLSLQYEDNVKNDCCGDAVLGHAIRNKTGERLQALYPTFAGDELVGLKVDQERWCIPLLALHRVSPQQLSSLWKWERTRPYDKYPFTHSTIIDYTLPDIPESAIRSSWDNYASNTQPDDSDSHSSVPACGSACVSDPECFQYLYSAGVCKFGSSFQAGKPKDGQDVTSGWDIQKITKLGYQKDPRKSSSCKEATWLKPVIR